MQITQISNNLYFSQIQIPIDKNYECNIVEDVLHDNRISELMKYGLFKGELLHLSNFERMNRNLVRLATISIENSIIKICKIKYNSTDGENIIFDIEFELISEHPLYDKIKSQLTGHFEPRYTLDDNKINIISVDVVVPFQNRYKLRPRYLYSKLGNLKLITIDLVYV